MEDKNTQVSRYFPFLMFKGKVLVNTKKVICVEDGFYTQIALDLHTKCDKSGTFFYRSVCSRLKKNNLRSKRARDIVLYLTLGAVLY